MKDITRMYTRLFIFLMPIIFLPVVVDTFGFGKNVLIIIMALIGVVIWLIDYLINKKTEIKVSRLLGLMAILTVWAWIGWFRMSAGVKMRSLTDLTGVGVITAELVWLFLWLQVSSAEERKKQLNWLTASGILVAVVSIIIFLIPSAKLPIVLTKNNPIISLTASWSLTGSILAEILLMLVLVLEWGKKLLAIAKQNGSYILEAIITSFLSLVLFLDIFKLFKNGLVGLDFSTAWVIAVETFKRFPFMAIFGIGAGNFVEAFNSFRPMSYNLTANWANVFLHSNNGILNLWTELGVVGLVLVVMSLNGLRKIKKDFDFVILLIVVLAGLFMPVSMMGMMLLAWVASEYGKKEIDFNLKIGTNGKNVLPIIMSVVLTLSVVFSGYWLYRIVLADIYMRQSVLTAAKNDGGSTYNTQIKAIALNQNVAEYRRMYSQTNVALASALLANKEITEEDKQKASTLIQQSIREAKAAIALDENNPVYWSNLASLYRQLVGVVDGAADWSFQSYQQAVKIESANPISKLELGGLLFAAKRFDEADRMFEEVINTKPDFANAWYNWAYSAKELKKLDYAVQRLTRAVALVPTTSGDYDKASIELETWQKELAASAQGSVEPKAETLKTAEPLPTAGVKEQVNVSVTELAPPAVEPTVSP